MSFDPGRRLGAGKLLMSILLLVAVARLSLAPALSAPTPKIVSVDVTGNLRVPTQTIMAVVAARPGQPYNPKTVADDLARINALGYFADIAPPLVRARPGGIAITYRVVENPVIPKLRSRGIRRSPATHCWR
jgi:outer membrane protein insertion porin family